MHDGLFLCKLGAIDTIVIYKSPTDHFSIVIFIFVLSLAGPAYNCTTTITGKDASADGSVMVSHTDDGMGDARLIFVPAMDHPEGARRPVFYDSPAMGFLPEWGGSQTHRLITDSRGPGYDIKGEPASVPLGYIPQVRHTYAYIDANYGIMNEHQVAIGECTNKAKIHPMPEAGRRIFYSSELSRVALERSKTAREAVLLMGELIAAYGYYGTGETLLVADPSEFIASDATISIVTTNVDPAVLGRDGCGNVTQIRRCDSTECRNLGYDDKVESHE